MSSKIGDYYLFELVNANNKFDTRSFVVREKIENLREIFLDEFNWRNKGYIVFLPNAYYAKKLLLNFFLKTWKSIQFFSNNRSVNGYIMEGEESLNVSYISKWSEALNNVENERSIFWFSDLDKKSNFKRDLEGWKGVDNKILVAETFRINTLMNEVDAFIFNIMEGVTALGFRKDFQIEPIILGSNSALSADETSYVLSNDYRRLEIGTLNIPRLLEIEFFYRNKIKNRTNGKKR